MEFSVLATSFNDENGIQRFFDNFEKQSLRPDYVVIVDGGSSDNTMNKIREISDQYHYKVQSYCDMGRLNIAQGYNEAIKKCDTELMILAGIGNDYSNNFCEEVINTYKNLSTNIVYTPIIGHSPNSFSRVFNIVFVGGKKGKVYSGASNRGVLISKTVLKKTGLFYEKFVYAGEDREYFDRARKLGFEMTCCNNAAVYWDTPISFKEHLNKSKFNAIADMQINSKYNIVRHILIRLFFLISIMALFLLKWSIAVMLVVFLFLIIWGKHKSINIGALFLRLHFIFLPSYYYLKLWKYTRPEYHFDEKDLPILE